MPRLRKVLAEAENAIVESNSILRFLRPTVFVTVVDASQADFKESAKRYLDRADACVVTGGDLTTALWDGVSPRLLAKARQFFGGPEDYCRPELVDFVRQRLE